MFEVGKDVLKKAFRNKIAMADLHNARLNFVYNIICLCFFVFISATLYFGSQGVDDFKLNRTKNYWTADRADILDRNGEVLATTVKIDNGYNVMLRKQNVKDKDKDKIATLIKTLFPDKYTFSSALELLNSSKQFIYIDKNISIDSMLKIKEAKIPGLEIETISKQRRLYPKGRSFSHVIGFINAKENKGIEGVELFYDDYLLRNIGPLQLSVDARIQSIFYEQLSIAMQKYRAIAAMGLLMNSRTGEILAMVSLPDFDPDNISWDPAINRTFKPLRNLYEMGSVFKAFNTAMALENHLEHKAYIVNKPFQIKDKFGRVAATIRDISSFKPKHPDFSVQEIMLHSCNVGSAQIALDLPFDAQEKFFRRIHFYEPLSLDFGKTEKTKMPKKWGPVERATVSFGHGISVTPFHLFLGLNAMVNGGFYIYPTLQKRGLGSITGERVISDSVSIQLRDIMYHIAEETSGQRAKVNGINIGGKTATAEKRDKYGKTDKKRNLTSFFGAFPIEAPQYVILIMLDEPKDVPESYGWRTAAWNAVPTTGKILDGILPLLFE